MNKTAMDDDGCKGCSYVLDNKLQPDWCYFWMNKPQDVMPCIRYKKDLVCSSDTKIEKIEDLTEEEMSWVVEFISALFPFLTMLPFEPKISVLSKQYNKSFYVGRTSTGINIHGIMPHLIDNDVLVEYKRIEKKDDTVK